MSGRKNSPLFIFNPEIRADLGTAPDDVIAARHGVHLQSINKWRNHFKIPPCPAEAHRRKRLRDTVPPDLLAKLGTAPDKVVAKELGLPWKRVAYLRAKLKIRRTKAGAA